MASGPKDKRTLLSLKRDLQARGRFYFFKQAQSNRGDSILESLLWLSLLSVFICAVYSIEVKYNQSNARYIQEFQDEWNRVEKNR